MTLVIFCILPQYIFIMLEYFTALYFLVTNIHGTEHCSFYLSLITMHDFSSQIQIKQKMNNILLIFYVILLISLKEHIRTDRLLNPKLVTVCFKVTTKKELPTVAVGPKK